MNTWCRKLYLPEFLSYCRAFNLYRQNRTVKQLKTPPLGSNYAASDISIIFRQSSSLWAGACMCFRNARVYMNARTRNTRMRIHTRACIRARTHTYRRAFPPYIYQRNIATAHTSRVCRSAGACAYVHAYICDYYTDTIYTIISVSHTLDLVAGL